MKRLLVVKLHALGDLVIHTPAFDILRNGLPEYEITLLTTDWAAPAVEGLDSFDHQIVVPTNFFFNRTAGSAASLARLIYKLRKLRFDTIVSFHKAKSLNRLLMLVSSNQNFYCYGEIDSEHTVKLDEKRHSAPNAEDLARLALSTMVGATSPGESLPHRYRWQISPGEMKKANAILNANSLQNGKYAMIFPGGGANPNATEHVRRWRGRGFAKVVDHLSDRAGLKVVLAGSRDDQSLCESVREVTTSSPINLAGTMSIRIMAALMSQARIVITNDSAPLHIAAAVGAPTLGIFGPTGAAYKLPPGDYVASVSLGLPCSPCYYGKFKGCLFSTIRCMEELGEEKVIQAADDLLDRTKN